MDPAPIPPRFLLADYLHGPNGLTHDRLAALPKRGTEAGAWQDAALSLLTQPDGPRDEERNRANSIIHSYFGHPERLKGVTDPDCHGCLVDVTISRMLPCKWNEASLRDQRC